jgi:hypothetical protein
MQGGIGTSGYTMRRPSIISHGGKGERTRRGKSSREVGNLFCPSSFLKQLLSIVASPTILRSFSCLVFVTSQVEPVGNYIMVWRSSLSWMTYLVYYLHTQPPSTAHIVDLEARYSAVSRQACVLIGMLELAPL